QEPMEPQAKPPAPRPRWFERRAQPCVAELLGTALFIFIGVLSVLEGGPGRLQPALAHGLALAATVAVLGDI
ncbi:AQP8 protein, partial [Prunella fulvescens]|nr:AQP8 protein [Prunella fulvescens]